MTGRRLDQSGSAAVASVRSVARACNRRAWMPPNDPLLMQRMWSPGPCRLRNLQDQFVDGAGHPCLGAHRGQHFDCIPAEAAGVAKGEVGLLQGPGQLALHAAQLHGVAARLEHRQDPAPRRQTRCRRPAGELAPKTVDGGADRRGMVCEIVIDRDAADGAAHFHAALDVKEIVQRLGRHMGRYARVLGGRDRCQRIELVVHPRELPVDLPDRQPALENLETVRLTPRRKVAHGGAETADLAPAAQVQDARQAFLQSVDHHASGGRHRAHQVMELPLDRREVVEDVGVVELQVVQHRRARPVVDELAALVEEGGVVLVGLDHERRRPSPRRTRIPQPGRNAEIRRDPADQETGLEPCAIEDPGQHRAGGGLAVGAGHRQHVPALQQLFGEPLRAAGVRQARVQDGFHERIAGCTVGLARA